MFVDSLDGRGLGYFIKNHARKIELTPFGKVKKKHKVLRNGSTAAAWKSDWVVDDVDNLYVWYSSQNQNGNAQSHKVS